MVISSRVVACTSRPVAFNGHPSTRGRLTGLRNKPQQKQTCQHLAVVYWQLVSLFMELSFHGENCSLTWCEGSATEQNGVQDFIEISGFIMGFQYFVDFKISYGFQDLNEISQDV